MGLIDGEDVLIADDPNAFADAVYRLYSDPNLWLRLQSAGLDYIKKNTSREVGLQIVSDALHQLDIPFVRRRTSLGSGEIGGSSPYGTRLEVTDIGSLVEAGKRVGPRAGAIDLVIVPEDAKEPGAGAPPSGVGTVSTWSAAGQLAEVKRLLVIADPTDLTAIGQLGHRLRADLPAGASCSIVFAPPRVVTGAGGYMLKAPFSDREVNEVRLPFHETLAEHFYFEGRETEWLIDATLTGFPSVTMLYISKRTTGRD
jgi:hypothetical protein